MHISLQDYGAGQRNEQKRRRAHVAREEDTRVLESISRKLVEAIGKGEVAVGGRATEEAVMPEPGEGELEKAVLSRKMLLSSLRVQAETQAKKRRPEA